MSGKEAGNFVLQFQKQGRSIDQVNEMLNVGANEARAYGLPINDVLTDMTEATDVMTRWGLANRREFAQAAAKARSYGLSIKEIDAAFGKNLATFQGTSEVAAKLNSVFGTMINPFELLMEKDSTKRMEKIREELGKQGKSWEKLSEAEKFQVMDTLKLSETQAALVLSSEEERKKLEKKANERKRQINLDNKWNQGLNSIKKTLVAWGPLIDNLMRSASNFVVRLFGGTSASDVVTKISNAAENGLKSINLTIENASKNIESFREILKSVAEPAKFVFKVLKVGALVVAKSFQFVWEYIGKLFNLIVEGWKGIGNTIIVPVIEKLTGSKIDLKSFDWNGFAKSVVADLEGSLDETERILSGDSNQQAKIESSAMKQETVKRIEKEKKSTKNKAADQVEKENDSSKKKTQDDTKNKKRSSVDTNKPIRVVLETINGKVIGGGLMYGALGSPDKFG